MAVGDLEQNVFKQVRVPKNTGFFKQLKRLELVCALLVLLFSISFGLAYYNECEALQADIELAKLQEPPVNCGPHARKLHELEWAEWIRHTLDDRSAEDCQQWLHRIHRSPWASPLHVFVKVCAESVGEPLRVWMDLLGAGLRSILSRHNLLLQIALLASVVILTVFLFKVFLFARLVSRSQSSARVLPVYSSPRATNNLTFG